MFDTYNDIIITTFCIVLNALLYSLLPPVSHITELITTFKTKL